MGVAFGMVARPPRLLPWWLLPLGAWAMEAMCAKAGGSERAAPYLV